MRSSTGPWSMRCIPQALQPWSCSVTTATARRSCFRISDLYTWARGWACDDDDDDNAQSHSFKLNLKVYMYIWSDLQSCEPDSVSVIHALTGSCWQLFILYSRKWLSFNPVPYTGRGRPLLRDFSGIPTRRWRPAQTYSTYTAVLPTSQSKGLMFGERTHTHTHPHKQLSVHFGAFKFLKTLLLFKLSVNQIYSNIIPSNLT